MKHKKCKNSVHTINTILNDPYSHYPITNHMLYIQSTFGKNMPKICKQQIDIYQNVPIIADIYGFFSQSVAQLPFSQKKALNASFGTILFNTISINRTWLKLKIEMSSKNNYL